MPELPEVQTVVSHLSQCVTGQRIRQISHIRTDLVTPIGCDILPLLRNRRIQNIQRRAKRIVFQLDDQNRFYIHLGMTGQLTCVQAKTALKPHTHLILQLDDRREIRFVDPRRFGQIVWMGSSDHEHLGPEPLSLRPQQLQKRLSGTTRAIKTALLDQTLIAGIGNIYADEALHVARIAPITRACDLSIDQIASLNRAIKRVLRRAIEAGGSTIRDYVNAAGERGTFQLSHRVYDREGEPCCVCKTEIVRIVLGGRSTHYCPRCQIV